MDRLTYKGPDGHWMISGYCVEIVTGGEDRISGPAIDRLAAYEDTGLEPEEVTAIKHALMGREIAKITEFDGIPIQRLQELAQAENDGRLVVLPCDRNALLIKNDGITFLGNEKHVMRLTREAAEAALEGEMKNEP